eukprot:307283-Rhodomonas_salina.2
MRLGAGQERSRCRLCFHAMLECSRSHRSDLDGVESGDDVQEVFGGGQVHAGVVQVWHSAADHACCCCF